MTGSPGFLEFFILEASDYVEQLDAALLGAGATGPDAESVQRLARALRGTATMAKLTPFADLAASVERIGRGLQDGRLHWDPALGGAVVAAVDDLKALLHSARNWTEAETRRALARAAELSAFAPAPVAGPTPPASQTPAAPFLATEATNIAAGLELLRTRPNDPDTATNVLRRVRALRGVAGVKEVAPLAEVLEAAEDCTRGLELNGEPLSDEARAVLEAGAAQLHHISAALRAGRPAADDSPERAAFRAAGERWQEREAERERIVPIESLFGDSASGVVEASPNPPTSVAERFRLELTSQGEHLRGVIAAARSGADAARSRRELRRAIRGLQAMTESFGQHEIAQAIGLHAEAAEHVDFLGLNVIDELAAALTMPSVTPESLRARLRELTPAHDQAAAIADILTHRPRTPAAPASPPAAPPAAPPAPPPASRAPTPAAPAPAAPPTPPISPAPVAAVAPPPSPTAPPATPAPPTRPLSPVSPHVLPDLLDSTIAALGGLTATPLVQPAAIGTDLVPIDELLYRGRAALDRALEIREEIKETSGQVPRETLDELFDLLDLARAE